MPSMYVVVECAGAHSKDYLSEILKLPYSVVNNLDDVCDGAFYKETPQIIEEQQPTLPTPPQNLQLTPVDVAPPVTYNPYSDDYYHYGDLSHFGYTDANGGAPPALPAATPAPVMSNTPQPVNPQVPMYPYADMSYYYGYNAMPEMDQSALQQQYMSTISPSASYENSMTSDYSPNMLSYPTSNISRRSDEGFYSEASLASCSNSPDAPAQSPINPYATEVKKTKIQSPMEVDKKDDYLKRDTSSKIYLWAVLCDALMDDIYKDVAEFYGSSINKLGFVVHDLSKLANMLGHYCETDKLRTRLSTYFWTAVQKGQLKRVKNTGTTESVYLFTESALEQISNFLEKRNSSLDDFFERASEQMKESNAILEEEDVEMTPKKRCKAGLLWKVVVDNLLDPRSSVVQFFGDGSRVGFSIKSVDRLSDQLFGTRGLSRGERTRKLRILLWNGSNTQHYIERVNGSLANYYFTDRAVNMLKKLLCDRQMTLGQLKSLNRESFQRNEMY